MTLTFTRRQRTIIFAALNERWWELYRMRSILSMTVDQLVQIDDTMAEIEELKKRIDDGRRPAVKR